MKIATSLGDFKRYFSIEKALNKVYEIKGRKQRFKDGRVNIYGVCTFPQILIGHKVKLVLVKELKKAKEGDGK